jgi:hypothetical protein
MNLGEGAFGLVILAAYMESGEHVTLVRCICPRLVLWGLNCDTGKL